MNHIEEAELISDKAYAFLPSRSKINITDIKVGSINKTYLISPVDNYDFYPFILQLINKSVFQSSSNLISKAELKSGEYFTPPPLPRPPA